MNCRHSPSLVLDWYFYARKTIKNLIKSPQEVTYVIKWEERLFVNGLERLNAFRPTKTTDLCAVFRADRQGRKLWTTGGI